MKREQEEAFRRSLRKNHQSQPAPAKRTQLNSSEKRKAKITNSKMLNEVFQQCVMPKMNRIVGKPRPAVDTGLDSHMHNYHIAESRRKIREKEMTERMKNPLTYPSKGERLRDQKRAVPSISTLAKLGILHDKKRYMGNIELENMIMDNISKIGLLVN